jgi:hypothetical protein
MARSKNSQKETNMRLSDKLAKCNDNVQVYFYDNGFMVEVGGRDHNDDWKTAKIMCPTLEDVNAVIVEASEMEKD